jgi:cytoskeletal protein RodZ
MSLINDALKRAEADKARKEHAHSSAPGPAMQPVESKPSAGLSPMLVGGVLLLGIGAIGIATALWFRGSAAPQQTVRPSKTSATSQSIAAAPTIPSEPISPIIQTTRQIAAASSPLPPPTNAQPNAISATVFKPAATPTSPTPATKAPPITQTQIVQRPTAPVNNIAKPVRLQSIFYRLRSPTVIINGKTLGVGDSVDDIRVVSIQRTSVEIVQNGKYRTLTLQD